MGFTRSRRVGAMAIAAGVAATAACTLAGPTNSLLPAYKPTPGLTGAIRYIGSGEVEDLFLPMGGRFARLHFQRVAQESRFSQSAVVPTLLAADRDRLGPKPAPNVGVTGRPLSADEIAAFERARGYPPFRVRVACTPVAVIVHRDNPAAGTGLSFGKLDAAFGGQPGAAGHRAVTWGDLGLGGEWSDKPVRTYVRDRISDVPVFFRQTVLGGGAFRADVEERLRSPAVVDAVASNRFAIGVCPLRFATAGVAVVPVSVRSGEAGVIPLQTNPSAYPLSCWACAYANVEPGTTPEPAVGEILRYFLTKDAQETARKYGYVPLDATTATEEWKALSAILGP